MREGYFKRDKERNGKNKNVLEFDVDKDDGIIFLDFVLLNKDNHFKLICFLYMILGRQ